MREGTLDPGLARLREELSQEIRSSAAETRAHAEALFADHRRQTDARFAETDAQIEETRRHAEALAVETRRHLDVVAEGLMSKIQLVAEGVINVDQKVERLREEMHHGFARVDRRFVRLEARIVTRERR